METLELEKLQYPIGHHNLQKKYTSEELQAFVNRIKSIPTQLREIEPHLTPEILNTPYRPGGWTVKQVIHHIADSHMNAFIRTKLLVTEDHPTIKPYNEKLWAETEDVSNIDVSASISIIEGMHARWTALLSSLKSNDLENAYFHPGYNRDYNFYEVFALYSWHGDHHMAHINLVLNK